MCFPLLYKLSHHVLLSSGKEMVVIIISKMLLCSHIFSSYTVAFIKDLKLLFEH